MENASLEQGIHDNVLGGENDERKDDDDDQDDDEDHSDHVDGKSTSYVSSSDSEQYSNLDQHVGIANACNFKTFKLVGDNIDKNINPQDVRLDSQTVSLHYFHSYAVRDRIDMSN